MNMLSSKLMYLNQEKEANVRILSEFEKGQSKTAALARCSRSAVVIIYQNWSKEGTVVN